MNGWRTAGGERLSHGRSFQDRSFGWQNGALGRWWLVLGVQFLFLGGRFRLLLFQFLGLQAGRQLALLLQHLLLFAHSFWWWHDSRLGVCL